MALIAVRRKIETSARKPPIGCSNWLEFWEREKGRKASKCGSYLCNWRADIGGHVIKGGEASKEYVLPLCAPCNRKPEDEEFRALESDLAAVR